MAQAKITTSREQIGNFCHKWDVTELSLFGSVLTEEFRPDSDVDVLVSFKDDARWSLFGFVDMIDDLQVIFGRRVDLVEKDAIKNPFRKQKIMSTKEVIYAA